jgi:hypothetical protein
MAVVYKNERAKFGLPSEVSWFFNLNSKILKLAVYPLKFQKMAI